MTFFDRIVSASILAIVAVYASRIPEPTLLDEVNVYLFGALAGLKVAIAIVLFFAAAHEAKFK